MRVSHERSGDTVRRLHSAPVALACLLVLGHDAWAQRGGQETIYGWDAPPLDRQLQSDTTVIPPGSGAVFIPTLTRPGSEPEVLVFRGDERIASGTTGARLVLPTGAYTVRIGSGTVSQTVTVQVEVAESETTIVPAHWGGLVVGVVDENNLPHRGTYELIRVDDREIFGIGYGADTLQGERLRTWLLPPGLYRIVRPGSTYRARTDFSTVYIIRGGLAHYKLVIDPETGELRGAGVVTAEELMAPGVDDEPFTSDLLVGLNVGLSHTDNVGEVEDDLTLSGELFLDTLLSFDDGANNFVAILEVRKESRALRCRWSRSPTASGSISCTPTSCIP